MHARPGFTLLELVAVLVMTSVAMLGMAKLWGNANRGLAQAGDSQALSRLAQDCAERIIQTRRDYGFGSALINSVICDPAPASFIRTVSVPASPTTGSAGTACPVGAACRNIVVEVCAGSGTACAPGVVKSRVAVMLVSY